MFSIWKCNPLYLRIIHMINLIFKTFILYTNIYFVVLQFLQFSSIQSLSCVWLFVTPWTAACQASLFITNSWSLLKLMSIESVMPSNHLILCHPLLLPPSIFPNIRVFSNESVLRIRWPKYWSFSFKASVLPMNTQDWCPLGWTGWVVMSSSLRFHGLPHNRLPCPSLSPGVCSNSCPLSQSYYPTILSSVGPLSSCPQSFPASGSFPMSQLFAPGGQIIGVSSSA